MGAAGGRLELARPERVVEDPDECVDHSRPRSRGLLAGRVVAGNRTAEQQSVAGGLAQRPLAHRTAERQELFPRFGGGRHGRLRGVAEFVVSVDDEQRQQFVAALDVPVDGGRHDAEVACDGPQRQGGGADRGQLFASDPRDVLQRLLAGAFSWCSWHGVQRGNFRERCQQTRALLLTMRSSGSILESDREQCSRIAEIDSHSRSGHVEHRDRHRSRTRRLDRRPAARRAGPARSRVLTRSGSGPDHPLIERRKVDVSDADALREAFDGAVAVYHCIHAAYSADAWERELPAAEQAVLEAAGRVGRRRRVPREPLLLRHVAPADDRAHPAVGRLAASAASGPGC